MRSKFNYGDLFSCDLHVNSSEQRSVGGNGRTQMTCTPPALAVIWDPFNSHGLTLFPVWKGYHTHYEIWLKLLTIPNYNGCTVEVFIACELTWNKENSEYTINELKWSGIWSTGTVGWLSASERGQDLEEWPRWIPSAWFHFHSCQTWYSGPLRIVLMAHQGWYHPKHSNQAWMG